MNYISVKDTAADVRYYSNHLKQKLDSLYFVPAAIVEAPSGYGKTTALRDHLGASISQETAVHWFTAADEAPEEGYRRLCLAVAKVDKYAGARLLRIGFPNARNLGKVCDALRSIRCDGEAWLVLDNYQLLGSSLPAAFSSVLLEQGGRSLHVVLITQQLGRELSGLVAGRGFLHLTAADLRLEAEDIRHYYALAGVTITLVEAQQIARCTEGWFIAVRLQLNAYQETGAFSDEAILPLMEQLIWNRWTDKHQELLLRIFPFENVTVQQICALTGGDALPGYVLDTLQNPFIRYDKDEGRYELHSLLYGLLCRKRRERGAAFERGCLLRAGDLCREAGRSVEALNYYRQAGDVERILSLDISAFYIESTGSEPFYKTALQLTQSCPPELAARYPLSMLRVAYVLKTAGKDAEFDALLNSLRPDAEGADSVESAYWKADWMLLDSLRCYPDIAGMMAVLERAAELFGGRRSRVIFPDSPWWYSVMTPFFLFHREPGGIQREAVALEKYFSLYTTLTGGHGAGADILFRAESAYYTGNLEQAEILAHKVVFTAQSCGQDPIRLVAIFYLAWISAHRGDGAAWRRAFSVLSGSISQLRHWFVLSSSEETLGAMFLSEMGMESDAIPAWLREGDFSGELLPDLEWMRLMMHLDVLLRQKSFARLVGSAEALYPHDFPVRRLGDVFPALITAVGYGELGRRAEAVELISRAAGFLLPDGLYNQLVVYDLLTDGLVEACICESFPEYARAFHQASEHLREPLSSVYAGLSTEELHESLTNREREIALLAAKGLHNGEIAKKLSISESTVRFHLRTVFQKLNVDRRSKLAEKLL